MTSHATELDLEVLLRRALEATATSACWTVDVDETWCHLSRPSGIRRQQGWKLHVSATAASAPEVLVKVLDVLLREESTFKFARSLEQVGALNSRATPRGSSGKFITVYPPSDDEAARLALGLHRATAGLTGPRILSDQPYAPQSLVHYRYGAFVGRRRVSEHGLLVWFIEDPDGNPVEDKRTGQYAPPPWAVSPFPVSVPLPPQREKAASSPVLLGGRFSVREAIRHTNKGGVYRGTDMTTGAAVVLKEARPHVDGDASGFDVRDWLRAEARALEKLKGTGLAPEPLALFETGGHLFLAQEEVPGVPLTTWVAEHFRDIGSERYRADALAQAGRLVDLVASAHAHGWVLRDFTPGNVMVRPDGELRLIDLELAVLEGDHMLPTTVGTPCFSAPERLEGAPVARSADYYSLGATMCFVLAGKVANLLVEEPATRPAEERFADWLTTCGAMLRLPDGVTDVILGLMRDDPAERLDPAAAREALRKVNPARPVRSAREPARTGAIPDATQVAIAGIVNHLVDSMTPADDGRLWPVSTLAGEAGPCTVQQGAAGVLAVLTRYYEVTADPRLPELISTAGHWIAGRVDTRSIRPGLHFGGRGTAWALYDAGRAVGDDELADRAVALALAPLESTPSYDVTHGSAGSGLAAVHLWHRTHDPRLADVIVADADRLAAAARAEPAGVSWPVPAEAVSQEAGKRYLGFAHGTAGIGCFLLAAAAVSNRREHLQLAVAAGESLAADVLMVGRTAQWPAQAGDVPTAPYWCHGAAGIGSFLIRLWQATGDERFGDLAHHAARAVMERASRAALTQCHGLAGNGDFLLDMAEATGDPDYRVMADDLATLIATERAHRGTHVVFPNEHGRVSTSWSDGASGILAFLLRSRHPSPRHWMIQQPG
ncbi:class IV lanthionine synthetase LanL [Streptomyces sp. ASQP_92]|uniref:class IV lanthionine synthetase LanL n=1 Tax=Streptomyces sp. ASQP_92 TaxID=2979116 RepID=UPI0021BE9D9F|nr:class IV lanthionine synthetase LanL [Streptomyces sp. ASQP_92]MCT9089811.1 class IV lanthionine synthetase LanL [Streptomyces sp. ASQP_92]